MNSVKCNTPLAHSVLYPIKNINNTLLKQISQKTSYIQVWLAFHPYSQIISAYCHRREFGLPISIKIIFNLFINRSPGFGYYKKNLTLYSNLFSLNLHHWKFRFAFFINSLAHYTKGTLWLYKPQLIQQKI